MSRLWHAHVLTLFPEMFPGPLGHSLPGRALQDGVWQLTPYQIRDYATDRHRTVDDTPYGGGAGMVMKPDIAAAALAAVPAEAHRIYLSPRGSPLTQAKLQKLAAKPQVALLCGRYEGLDQRVIDVCHLEEISLGDFVLAGGELPAMALMEGVVRLLPGVLGNTATTGDESFSAGLLEYPHYTRPPVWQGLAVPDVLLGGDHAKIDRWRREQAEALTKARRPDLWTKIRK